MTANTGFFLQGMTVPHCPPFSVIAASDRRDAQKLTTHHFFFKSLEAKITPSNMEGVSVSLSYPLDLTGEQFINLKG